MPVNDSPQSRIIFQFIRFCCGLLLTCVEYLEAVRSIQRGYWQVTIKGLVCTGLIAQGLVLLVFFFGLWTMNSSLRNITFDS